MLLEKLTGSQLVKKHPAFYGTRRFITAFTTARHLSLSQARSVQSMPLVPLLEDQFFKLSLHRRLGVSTSLFLSATASNKMNERITDCKQIISEIQMFQYSLQSSVLHPHRLSPTPPSVSQHTRKSWDKQPPRSITKYSLRCEVSNHSYA